MSTETHDFHDLALRFIVAKLALGHKERLSEDQRDLADEEHRLTTDRLLTGGFTTSVRIGNRNVLVPRTFLPILQDGAPDSLLVIHRDDEKSVAVSRQKVIDRYYRLFL